MVPGRYNTGLIQGRYDWPMADSTNIWEGCKVRLRAFREDDVAVLMEHHNQDTEAERLAGAPEFPRSVTHYKKFVEERMSNHSYDHDNIHLAIETLDNEFIGHVVSSGTFRRMGHFGFGIHLFRPYWRKGYGTEGAALFLRFFFKELRYHYCESSCWEFNQASYALHKRLGFKEEGRRREKVFHNGKRYDEIMFGMTVNDFDKTALDLPPVDFYEMQD